MDMSAYSFSWLLRILSSSVGPREDDGRDFVTPAAGESAPPKLLLRLEERDSGLGGGER
jgi:hypothetical protein